MSNILISAISENEATGEVAEIYDDIKSTLGNGVVNLIWRHLATIEGALPWVWNALKPLYVDDVLKNEAALVCDSIKIPSIGILPSAALQAVNISDLDKLTICDILDSYNKGNAFNLLALSALTALPLDKKETASSSVTFAEDINIPDIVPLDNIVGVTKDLVLALSKLGAPDGSKIIPSLYRHLAYWPGFLSLSWSIIAPLHADGRLGSMVDLTYKIAEKRAANIADVVVWGGEPDTAAQAMKAIHEFRLTAISRMLPIGLILRIAAGK